MFGVPMPAEIVLIVCSALLGEPDMNSSFTGFRAAEWNMADGVMHCRRMEVQLYDPAVDQGADPMPFNQIACNRAIVMQGSQFDVDRMGRDKDQPAGSKTWRFYRGGCPVPTVDTKTGRVLSWSLPPCGKWGTIICDQDTAI